MVQPLNGTAFLEPSVWHPLPHGTKLSPLACPIPLESACCCCARVPFPATPRWVQLYFLAPRFWEGRERKGYCLSPFCLKICHAHLSCKDSLGSPRPIAAEFLIRAGLR